MYTILLSTILFAAGTPEMRIEQTQPQHIERVVPLPPGCGPYWNAQPRIPPFIHFQPYYQPYYQPYPRYYYPYYRW